MASSATVRPRNPLKTFQFRVKVRTLGMGARDEYVAGCRSVSGLQMSVSPFETWEGGNNLHRYVNPNKINWDPIVLEQGLALDDTLEGWAIAVADFARTGTRPVAFALKREVVIEVWDPYAHGPDGPNGGGGDPVPGTERFRVYNVHNAWVSKFHALPKLDATTSEVGLVTVELQHEGWEIDTASFSPPPPLPPRNPT
jgi:phage tail-like protein